MKALPFCVTFLLLMLFSFVLFFPEQVNRLYAQYSTVSQISSTVTQPTPTTLGVKITTPTNEQQIFFNNNSDLQLKGTSTDNVDKDCQVSVIANDIRPYQNTTATGQGGKNDYSTWIYSLAPTLVKEGSNKVTARISCVDPDIIEANAAASTPTPTDANIVKHSSVFFTVQNTPTTTASTPSSSITNSPNTTETITSTATTSTSVRTKAMPYFMSNPNCQVQSTSNDLSCTIKIAGIENIANIRPFLHADLTTSCINPSGNSPPAKLRTTPLIGDSKTIQAVVDANCPPPMTPSYTYKNVELQVGDVLLSIPGTFSSK
jgi:hypothetical protein